MIYDVQKASVLKRASAFLLDIILVAVLATGFMALLSVICNYDAHYKNYTEIYKQTAIEINEKYKEIYNVDFNVSEDEYNALSADDKAIIDAHKDEVNKDFSDTLKANPEFVKEASLVPALSLMITSIGIFLSMLILEFVFPICFKNGQTIGKKVFGIAVMHTNGLRVRPFSMFVRSILGMYVFEIMVPVLIILMMVFGTLNMIVGICVLVALCILQLVVFIVTRNTSRSFLHDLIAKTVTVDLASQMIFDNEEEMLEFKKAEQNALAERNNYRENGGFDFYNSSLNYRKGKKIVDENGNNIENKQDESVCSDMAPVEPTASAATEQSANDGTSDVTTQNNETKNETK